MAALLSSNTQQTTKAEPPTSNPDSTPTMSLEPPNPPSPTISSTSTLPVEAPQTTTAVAEPKTTLTKIVTGPKPTSKPTSIHTKENDKPIIHTEVDHTAEFTGEVNTTNELPSSEIVQKIGEFTVLDREGKSVPFRNVYSGPNVVRRVLVIFIRHFFCGNCQEYIRSLSATPSLSPQNLLSQSPPTFICVIGCGSPSLIPMWASQTGCPYPIYTDPTKQLYTTLKLIRTFNPGTKPEYMKKSMFGLAVQSVVQGVKELGKGRVFNNGEWGGGDMGQVGGEFLFESKNADYSPGGISPGDEVTPNANLSSSSSKGTGDYLQAGNAQGQGEDEKVVTWCHRMKNTRDHAEVSVLMKVLGVDEEEEKKRKEFSERKLTGMSARSKASLAEEFEKGMKVEA